MNLKAGRYRGSESETETERANDVALLAGANLLWGFERSSPTRRPVCDKLHYLHWVERGSGAQRNSEFKEKIKSGQRNIGRQSLHVWFDCNWSAVLTQEPWRHSRMPLMMLLSRCNVHVSDTELLRPMWSDLSLCYFNSFILDAGRTLYLEQPCTAVALNW